MRSTPFHAKNGLLETKRRWYFRDQITDKNFTVIARSHPEAVRKAFKKAKHTDLLFQAEGTP